MYLAQPLSLIFGAYGTVYEYEGCWALCREGHSCSFVHLLVVIVVFKYFFIHSFFQNSNFNTCFCIVPCSISYFLFIMISWTLGVSSSGRSWKGCFGLINLFRDIMLYMVEIFLNC